MSTPPASWRTYEGIKASSYGRALPRVHQNDSDMEDDATVDQESEIREPKIESLEDDEMAVCDAISISSSSPALVEVEDSNHEESEKAPLKADSPWTNTAPEREEILRLRRLWAPKDLPPDGALPNPTARDVAFTAFSSVQFLRDMQGTAIKKSEIGIDHAGRLFDLEDGGRDFHGSFDNMVMEIRRDSQAQPTRKRIEKTLTEYIEVDQERDWTECMTYGMDAYSSLIECSRAVVEAQRFEIRDLRHLRTKCAKTLEEMNKVVLTAKAVALDLKDTGSTSSKRWKELVRMEHKPFDMEWLVVGNPVPRHGHRKIIQVLESFTRPYQKFVGRTLHLDDCLLVAIEELMLPVDGFRARQGAYGFAWETQSLSAKGLTPGPIN